MIHPENDPRVEAAADWLVKRGFTKWVSMVQAADLLSITDAVALRPPPGEIVVTPELFNAISKRLRNAGIGGPRGEIMAQAIVDDFRELSTLDPRNRAVEPVAGDAVEAALDEFKGGPGWRDASWAEDVRRDMGRALALADHVRGRAYVTWRRPGEWGSEEGNNLRWLWVLWTEEPAHRTPAWWSGCAIHPDILTWAEIPAPPLWATVARTATDDSGPREPAHPDTTPETFFRPSSGQQLHWVRAPDGTEEVWFWALTEWFRYRLEQSGHPTWTRFLERLYDRPGDGNDPYLPVYQYLGPAKYDPPAAATVPPDGRNLEVIAQSLADSLAGCVTSDAANEQYEFNTEQAEKLIMGAFHEVQGRFDPPSTHEPPGAAVPETNEDLTWNTLICAAIQWAQHLDQWDKFQFDTKFGPVYVSISRETQYPESYNRVPYDYQGALIPAKAMDPGAAVLAGGETKLPDRYLIRCIDGWYLSPGAGCTNSFGQAHRYTRQEAEDVVRAGNGSAEIIPETLAISLSTNNAAAAPVQAADPDAQAEGVAQPAPSAQVARNHRELPSDHAQGILADGVAAWTAEKDVLFEELADEVIGLALGRGSDGTADRLRRLRAAAFPSAAPVWPPADCRHRNHCGQPGVTYCTRPETCLNYAAKRGEVWPDGCLLQADSSPCEDWCLHKRIDSATNCPHAKRGETPDNPLKNGAPK